MAEPKDLQLSSDCQTSIYFAESNECIGNGVFAANKFEPGTLIFSVRRPLIGSLDPERLEDTCANCYMWTAGDLGSRLYVEENAKVHACTGCKRVRYCSKACQKEAWQRVHKHECKIFRKNISNEFPKAVQAVMEILIRKKHGLMTEQQWRMLCDLGTHLDDFKKGSSYGGIKLMAMGTLTLSWTQDMFDVDFVEAMYARVLSNSLTLITPSFDPLGIIFDEKLCQINHSCDPNAYIVMDGAEVSLRALKPIKKDDEIYISYIDTTNPYARRQTELKARWFFTCNCSKCQKGPTLSEDAWAIAPQDVPDKWKEYADVVLAKELDPANYVGDSQAEKRVAALQASAYEMHESAQSMSEYALAIRRIEGGMQLCCESKLWPLYRQPYAALRDDLIVDLLSVGDFQTAWVHCAKRYRYILPKLYPQKAHPIRVVQIWQTAMLALYLSDEPAPPGVEMALIAMMLVMEVRGLCTLSHGEKSPFTRSVKLKFDQMTGEFRDKLGPDAPKLVASEMPHQRDLFLEMGLRAEY